MFTPQLSPNIIFFSFKLTVPTLKLFIKIVMFDMNRLDIMHLKNKSNLGLLYTNPGSTDTNLKGEKTRKITSPMSSTECE